jgi:hypothetical protein
MMPMRVLGIFRRGFRTILRELSGYRATLTLNVVVLQPELFLVESPSIDDFIGIN